MASATAHAYGRVASGDFSPRWEAISNDRPRGAQPYETPFRAIQREVEESGAELVVIGTSRYAVLKRAFWRSVANEVLRKVACDVLIASPAAARRMRPQRYPARSEMSFAHTAVH